MSSNFDHIIVHNVITVIFQMLGFAKLRGFSPWPARMIGQTKADGRIWVRFFGKNQLGTIPRKNWTKLSPESHETIGMKNILKAGYKTALDAMIVASEVNADIAEVNTEHPETVDIQSTVEVENVQENVERDNVEIIDTFQPVPTGKLTKSKN